MIQGFDFTENAQKPSFSPPCNLMNWSIVRTTSMIQDLAEKIVTLIV
jgi:hypothetical protein